MDREYFNILHQIDEGIIIANMDLEIVFLNNKIKEYIGNHEDMVGTNILKAIPSLDKRYFTKALEAIVEEGHNYFFSSALHENLISEELKINIKLSKLRCKDLNYIMLECIDVTNQTIRINQLKEHSKELQRLNKKLKEQEEEITRLAYYDSLTGLANRTLFYTVADRILKDSIRNNKLIGLMFIDVDKFKSINDNYGHAVGDMVLKKVSEILEENIRATDIAARYGGDEFLILLTDCKSYCNYEIIAKRIKESDRKVVLEDGTEIDIKLSIGVSLYPKDGETIDQLISKADKAMYKVKSQGGNKYGEYNCR